MSIYHRLVIVQVAAKTPSPVSTEPPPATRLQRLRAKLEPQADKDPALTLCFEVFRYLRSHQPELLEDEHRDAILAAVSVRGGHVTYTRPLILLLFMQVFIDVSAITHTHTHACMQLVAAHRTKMLLQPYTTNRYKTRKNTRPSLPSSLWLLYVALQSVKKNCSMSRHWRPPAAQFESALAVVLRTGTPEAREGGEDGDANHAPGAGWRAK